MKNFFSEKREINYVYFSCVLIFLSALSFSHFCNWAPSLKPAPLFFLLYGFGQAIVEVSIFILIGTLLKRWAKRWIYLAFIGVSFILMLLHFTQFIMVKLMDASIWYVFKFLFGSGLDHLIAGFQALNLNQTMIAIILFGFLFIPLMGIGFYRLTFWLAVRKPLNLSLRQIGSAIGIGSLFLLLLDFLAFPFLTKYTYLKYQKTLPFGTTFLSPAGNYLHLNHPIPPPRNEETAVRSIPHVSLKHLPNIYCFIIETFRKDFLEAAPCLAEFAKENIQFANSFANANSTHLSWFSIFHADLPFYWTAMRDDWTRGSIPLQFLKKLGYQIRIYSSADLRFFNMDKLILGNHRELAARVEEYTFDRTIEPCQRDALAIDSLERDLEPQGCVYLIFLDSTHSEYSFPKDFPLQYEPIAKEIDYLTIGPKSPDLHLIKNRYRNAIAYVDTLMNRFFKTLKERKLYDDAIIAITGDHGEEFFEEGALFHGTHLNDYQTAVPILLKFPSKQWEPQTDSISHIDLFPSILHYLTKQNDFTDLFDGRSVFSINQLPFRVAVLHNGPHFPSEFLISNANTKFRARIVDPSTLEIIESKGEIGPNLFAPLSKK